MSQPDGFRWIDPLSRPIRPPVVQGVSHSADRFRKGMIDCRPDNTTDSTHSDLTEFSGHEGIALDRRLFLKLCHSTSPQHSSEHDAIQ